MSIDLDQRTRLPDELRGLLTRYPRDSWRDQRSAMAQFWLDIHEGFRRETAALRSAADDYRSDRKSPPEFAQWIAPRIQWFVSHLQGHHQIEDFHYFPSFRAAEQRLARGIDILANDHELLHQSIATLIDTVNAFFEAVRERGGSNLERQRRAADRYIEASELLYRRLLRHLDDEEDLIIPLMLQMSS